MKVIIAGSRSIDDYSLVLKAIKESEFDITEVVSGGARGVDKLGERWAGEHGIAKITVFRPRWYKDGMYNPRGGFERNERMAQYAEALIAVWDGKSSGTRHMIDEARRRGLKRKVVCIVPWPEERGIQYKLPRGL